VWIYCGVWGPGGREVLLRAWEPSFQGPITHHSIEPLIERQFIPGFHMSPELAIFQTLCWEMQV
jgi:hypothetical protein